MRRVVLAAVVPLVLFFEGAANAQVHWDASAQAGVMKRWLTGDTPVSAGFGPTAQVSAHVALLPLIHVGGYFGHDIAPLSGDASARDITFGGIRIKGTIPGLHGAFRSWIFGGFGVAGVYARSYYTTFDVPTGFETVKGERFRVEGAGGHYFEVPFGLGASYSFFKPWAVMAELGARAGFAHSGSVYEQPGPQATFLSQPTNAQNAAPAGLDRFALGLTLGILLDL